MQEVGYSLSSVMKGISVLPFLFTNHYLLRHRFELHENIHYTTPLISFSICHFLDESCCRHLVAMMTVHVYYTTSHNDNA